MDKKQVCKLKPGTFVEILWTDSKPTVGMILKKPVREKGDVAITLLHCDSLGELKVIADHDSGNRLYIVKA